MPVKPLAFKGDKKPSKKRKHTTSSDPAPSTTTSSLDPASEESWTHPSSPSDLTGPVIFVLPSTRPPHCLATDALGAVFASPLENLIESDPFTAEPHDVRQVWIATRVAGTEELSFKAAHGGYLACDEVGMMSAKREARGREEGWMVEEVADEEAGDGRRVFRLKTAASGKGEEGKYLSVGVDEAKKSAVTIRGDGSMSSAETHITIRMQARFKPQLQAQKSQKAKEKVSRQELEAAVGRKLEDDEVRRLKRARKVGTYHEEILDVRVKGKHDKFAS